MRIKQKSRNQIMRGFAVLSIALIFAVVLTVVATQNLLWVWPVIFGGALAFWIFDEFLNE